MPTSTFLHGVPFRGAAAPAVPPTAVPPGRGTLGALALFLGVAAGSAASVGFPAAILPLGLIAGVLLFLCIWGLPERAAPMSPTVLSGLFFGFFAIVILWPDYIALTGPGLPWITPRRLFAILLLLAFALYTSISSPWRKDMGGVLRDSGLLWKLVLSFAVIQCVSVLSSPEPVYSLNRALSSLITDTLIFFAGCLVFAWPGRVERLVLILLATLVPMLAIGAYEAVHDQVPWARFGGSGFPFLNLDHPLVLKILEGSQRAALGTYRAQGPFSTPLGFAEYLALTFPFLLHLLCQGQRASARLFALVMIPAVVWLVLLSGSRLGIVGVCGAVLMYPALLALVQWRHNRQSILGPLVVLSAPVGLVLFLLASQFVGRVRNLVWGNGAQRASNNARVEQFDMAMDLLAKQPLGYGAGRSAQTLGFTNPAGELTIDSYFLALGLEYGVFGIIVFYALFAAVLIRGLKTLFVTPVLGKETSWMLPLMTALTLFLVIKSIFAQVSNHVVVFAFLAAMAGLIHQAEKARRTRTEDDAAEAVRTQPRRPVLIHATATA